MTYLFMLEWFTDTFFFPSHLFSPFLIVSFLPSSLANSWTPDTNHLPQNHHNMYEEEKALMDGRWEQEEARSKTQMNELREMVRMIHDDMERDRSKYENKRRESQEGKLFLVTLISYSQK